MEKIVEQVLNSENWRMLAIMASGLYGFVKLNTSFGKKFYALDKKIDELKYNDFARLEKRVDGLEASLNKRIDGLEYSLNRRIDGVEKRIYGVENAVKALTFTLEKNKFLEKEDKEYIAGMLDR